VIHAGALVDISKGPELLNAINRDAAVQLWERALECGIESFVFFSSASIYAGKEGRIAERDPLDPAGPYEQSKFLAEKALLRSKWDGAACKLVILRPALIVGPHGTALMATVATLPPLFALLLGYAPRAYGGPRTNIVHALDVARAAIHLMRNGQDGEAYNVCNDDDVPVSDFSNVACREYGLPVLPLPPVPLLPKGVMHHLLPLAGRPELFAVLNAATSRIWEHLRRKHGLLGDLRPKFDKEMMGYTVRDSVFDNAKLKATGFALRFTDFASVVRDAMEWYQQERWIPRRTEV
jgi:nucleoside-diphosphate-sugar epimerase